MDHARRSRTCRALKTTSLPPDAGIARRPERGNCITASTRRGVEEIMSHVLGTEDVALEGSFTSSDKRTMTDIEVAARLGVSRFTVRSWRLKGVGPRFLKMGRAVRYRPHDVDEYERQALVETQAQSDHMPM